MTRRTRMKQEVEQSLRRGVEWLIRQQGADGGWHSATYGQLKDGAAVTTLAMYALAHLPAALKKKCGEVWPKASDFASRGIAKRGTIASPNGTLDFPTYAAALWLEAQRQWQGKATPDQQRQVIVDYLLAAQVAES